MSRRVNQAVISRPTRIAFVTGGLKLGGATSFLCNLAGELLRRQVPAMVFSFDSENPMSGDFTRLKIPVSTQDERATIYEDRLTNLFVALNQFQPTAVVANLGPTSFEVLRYLPPGVFRIGVAHSDDAGVYRVLRQYAQQMDLMATVSQTIKTKLVALPEFSQVPVQYLPLGVPMPADHEVLGRDFSQPLRILYLGRLDQEQKRVRLFPEMLHQLQASGIPFHWTIAGDGPERVSLAASMTSPGPNQTVSFPGRIAYEQVPALLAQHDVFLLASDYEGLPLTLLEAMGQGLVPVVSDLPSGIRELVDETTGIRIPPQEVHGYMAAIIQLHQQRDRMIQLSRAAREKVRNEFSTAAMTDRWLNAIPVDSGPTIVWPEKIKVKPIFCASNRWMFSPPVRWVRRAMVRFR
jgi:glycosyltransferase involved in cell wall biosynthesis